jgi:hypothetical protein
MAALLLCTCLSGYRDRARAYSAALCAQSFVTEPGAAARDCRRIPSVLSPCYRVGRGTSGSFHLAPISSSKEAGMYWSSPLPG